MAGLRRSMGLAMRARAAPVAKAAAATLSVTEIQSDTINYSGAVANLTTPPAVNFDAALPTLALDTGWDFTIINTGSGIVTLVGGAGVTVTGSAAVAVGASGRFGYRKVAAGTWAVYRLS